MLDTGTGTGAGPLMSYSTKSAMADKGIVECMMHNV